MSDIYFKVVRSDDIDEAQRIFARFAPGDVHLDPRYLKLFETYNKQQALYFYYTARGGEFLMAFFERVLPDFGTGVYKDILSPWYYGGPLHTFKNISEAQNEFPKFLQEIDSYCLANNIISQFQRFNPALQNQALYTGDPGLLWNRKVVSIDLTKDLDTIRGEYDYKVRKNLRRSEKEGFRIFRGVTPETIEYFKKVYIASMDRKTAGKFYYFDEKFYTDLFAQFPEEAQLFTVYKGEEVAASSLVLGNGTILHDYLRAAYPQFMAMRPNDLVVDAIVEWAKSAGYEQYSLGGGHSTKEDDSLLGFKKSFSPTTKDFYVYKKVHNHEAYARRCKADGKNESEPLFEKADFFPEYKTV